MKKSAWSLLTLGLIGLGFTTLPVHAAETDFAVAAIIPTNQENQQLNYFNLVLAPNESQTLNFHVINISDKAVKINASFGIAFTGSSGTVGYTPNSAVPDASLKYDLSKYVKLPDEITLPAHTTKEISAQVTMPKDNFDGVISGGFNFEEVDDSSAKAHDGKNLAVVNKFRYVIGLNLQENRTLVKPELSLNTVDPAQVNGRNVISANLSNSARAFLMQMNTQATVTNDADKSVSYKFSNAQMEMAPNSNFNLGIPVSIQGTLNGKSSQPLKPGNYHLSMIVHGNQDPNGPYKAVVNGKPVNYDYEWKFERAFTISGAEAKTLNAKDVSVPKTANFTWLFIIMLALLILFFIFFLLWKRRKKDDEKPTNANQK
jgi:LPXTG-motif cell wall-anchored protein